MDFYKNLFIYTNIIETNTSNSLMSNLIFKILGPNDWNQYFSNIAKTLIFKKCMKVQKKDCYNQS